MDLTSLFNVKGLVLAAGIGAAVAAVPTGILTYKVMHGALVSYQLQVEQAKAEAVRLATAIQFKQDQLNQDAAVQQAKRDQREADLRAFEPERIILHVKDTSTCITYGLVRVLNNAASGDTAALGLAPGQSDDACAPVTWRSFAGDVTDDYISARANGEQLNALSAAVQALHAAATADPAQVK